MNLPLTAKHDNITSQKVSKGFIKMDTRWRMLTISKLKQYVLANQTYISTLEGCKLLREMIGIAQLMTLGNPHSHMNQL